MKDKFDGMNQLLIVERIVSANGITCKDITVVSARYPQYPVAIMNGVT